MSWQGEYDVVAVRCIQIWFKFPVYVDTNLVGTHKIAQAAIFGLAGGVWAASRGFTVHRSLWIAAISLTLPEYIRFLRQNRMPLWKRSPMLKTFKRKESTSQVASTSQFQQTIAQFKGRKGSVAFLEFLPVLLTDPCERSLAWGGSGCEDQTSRSCRCIWPPKSSGWMHSYRRISSGLSYWTGLLGEVYFFNVMNESHFISLLLLYDYATWQRLWQPLFRMWSCYVTSFWVTSDSPDTWGEKSEKKSPHRKMGVSWVQRMLTKPLLQNRHRCTASKSSSTTQVWAIVGSPLCAEGGRKAFRLHAMHVRTQGVDKINVVTEHRAKRYFLFLVLQPKNDQKQVHTPTMPVTTNSHRYIIQRNVYTTSRTNFIQLTCDIERRRRVFCQKSCSHQMLNEVGEVSAFFR